MILDTFNHISKNKLICAKIYVKIDAFFLDQIKSLIRNKYGTLKNFNLRELNISYATLRYEFQKAKYHPLNRLLKIAKIIGLNKREVLNYIKGFRILGSHKKRDTILPRNIIINNNFVEGYALYLAEGDTGLNGKTLSRKLRLTNSELDIIGFFIQWLRAYFSDADFYLAIILPEGQSSSRDYISNIYKIFHLDNNQVKINNGCYNKKIKYRVCCDNAILIDLVLSLDKIVKAESLKRKRLAAAYIRGMMAGEGTVYFNRSRYVRIEMKNKEEINYIYRLLKILNYQCNLAFRNNRPGMWSIYIGASQLRKFYQEIGFGAHKKREDILKAAVGKKLRINQYC